MKKFLAVALLAATPAFGAPFLLSDPWPAAGAQPDTCTAVDGAATIPLTLVTVGGAKQIKHDVAGMTGAHTFAITCSNSFGPQAGGPVNFTFTAGVPTAPASLRLAP